MAQLVDWHTHCFLPEHISAEDRALQKRRGVQGTQKAEPELHRSVVDEAGVAQFVVVSMPRRAGVHTPHEFIADYVARYPGRAVGFASVHPRDVGAAAEFEHAVTTLGLKGLKLSPTYQAVDPRSIECCRLYEIADHH